MQEINYFKLLTITGKKTLTKIMYETWIEKTRKNSLENIHLKRFNYKEDWMRRRITALPKTASALETLCVSRRTMFWEQIFKNRDEKHSTMQCGVCRSAALQKVLCGPNMGMPVLPMNAWKKTRKFEKTHSPERTHCFGQTWEANAWKNSRQRGHLKNSLENINARKIQMRNLGIDNLTAFNNSICATKMLASSAIN